MMRRTQSQATALAERLCRPQRVGVFGHRGAGKTTLLTMLYREAVGGRLPGLRLAAADARTADYLSDKVLQLEAGQSLPATLGETELRFHLYHEGARLDLLVMDYQGEHVAVGRNEPIRDFLRECDAVWLCLDVPVTAAPGPCLRAQQEVEQLVEDYLTAEPHGTLHRPMALVLTKADLLGPAEQCTGPVETSRELRELVDRHFGMTRHALRLHSPHHAEFAVSSLGGPPPALPMDGPAAPEAIAAGPPEVFRPTPAELDGPLGWLSEALRGQDEARMERVWELAGGDLALLGRCVECFARRYPDAPATKAYRERLARLRRDRLRRRGLTGFAAVAALLVALWGYDAWGQSRAQRFDAEHGDDPVAVRRNWVSYRAWHPTRALFRPAVTRAEEDRLRELDSRIRERERGERLADLRRRAADPDADPDAVWQQLQAFRADFPEHDIGPDWQHFRAGVKARHDAQRERQSRRAFEELERAEQRAELPALVDQAGRFLREYAGTTYESEVRRRHASYLLRLDERDIEPARSYTKAHPLNFHTRREHYQRYLDRHPDGAFAREATEALAAIETEWDKQDFRAVRDHFRAHLGDIKELGVLCRSYLAVHPRGRFRAAATDLLRWGERVTTPGEYRVVLRKGSFDRKVAAFFSRGPSLSVMIEVNGVPHGPSSIVKRSYAPEWNYEFPRRVAWKLGDRVVIRVTDNYFWKRQVLEIPINNDPLAMRFLSGEVSAGNNFLTFESDFTMPTIPKIE